MAHTKVSVIRNWYGKVPKDKNGDPIPKNLWPKRRKHSWEVRWYSSDGKRYSKSFKSRKEATEYSKQLQDKVDMSKADKPEEITLEEFMREHETIMAGQVTYGTLKDQIRALKFFSEHIGGDILLTKIKPAWAESFVANRIQRGLAIDTVNKDVRTLKAVFNRAIELRHYLPEGGNPFAKIKQRRTTPPEPRYITSADFSKVLHMTDNLWWHAVLLTMYTSGIRKNELFNLTWADIDFEAHMLRVCPKRETTILLRWEPKDHEQRVIPIPPQIIQLLASLQSESDLASPYVFIGHSRLAHIYQRKSMGWWNPKKELVNNVLTRLKRFCRRADVKEFCLHDLRRTCITNWAQKLPIQTVKKLAGHSSIDTTQKYYLSVRPSDMDMARDIQDKLLTQLTNY